MRVRWFSVLLILGWFWGCSGLDARKGMDGDTRARAEIQEENARRAHAELDGKNDGPPPVDEQALSQQADEMAAARPETSGRLSSQYIKAIGIGESDAEARKMAKAELSHIFEANISSQVLTNAKLYTDESGAEKFQKNVELKIQIVSDVQLRGVQIGRTWYDEKSRAYYAEAVLDRYRARDEWVEDIEDVDLKIQTEFKHIPLLKSPISRLKPVQRILKLWIERDIIAGRLQVIGFSEPEADAYELRSIFDMIAQIKTEMRIYISISGEYGKDVEGDIAAELTGEGFSLSPIKDGADVLVAGTLSTEPLALDKPDWKFVRAKVVIDIIDLTSGIRVGEVSHQARKGRLDQKEAEYKAVKSASGAVSEKIVDFFSLGS
jgi:hypothetical protein